MCLKAERLISQRLEQNGWNKGAKMVSLLQKRNNSKLRRKHKCVLLETQTSLINKLTNKVVHVIYIVHSIGFLSRHILIPCIDLYRQDVQLWIYVLITINPALTNTPEC